MRRFHHAVVALCAAASSACVSYSEPSVETDAAGQALAKGQYLLTLNPEGGALTLTNPTDTVTALTTASSPSQLALRSTQTKGSVRVLVADVEGELSEIAIDLNGSKKGRAAISSEGALVELAPPGSGSTRGHFSPVEVVFDAKRNLAYVPGLSSTAVVDFNGTLTVSHLFDLVAGSNSAHSFLGSTFRGIGPVAATVTDSGDVFVCNLVTSNVSWVRNGTFQKPIEVGELPMGIASDEQYVYVASLLSNDLRVLSQDSGELKTTIPVGAGPVGVAVDRSRDLVYVANFLSGDITVIDTTTLMETAYSPLPATNFGTLLASVGMGSSQLQGLFNQFAGGGGLSSPLKRLLAGSATDGLDGLLTESLGRFVRSLKLSKKGRKHDFPVIRTVKVEGDKVYVLDSAHDTLMVLDADAIDDGDSEGETVADVGPGLVVFKPCTKDCDPDNESESEDTKSSAASPSAYAKGATVAPR
jgi:YVTN family beta-propeller protein